MNENKEVILLKAEEESLSEALREALKFTGFRSKGTIVIKPNICMPQYVPGAVTSPSLLYSLVGLLREKVEEVIVGESDGYNYSCNLAFKKTGIDAAVKKAGGRTLNFSKDKFVEVRFRESHVKTLILPKTLLEADALINAPVMKTHEFTIYSGAMKNLFGLIPDKKRIFLHPYLSEVLFNLFSFLKPKVAIMDALTAMEKNGPTRGTPVKTCLILSSKCPLALDIVATKIMGIDWKEINHLNYIARKVELKEEDVKTVGYDLAKVRRKFALPIADLPVRLQHEIFKHDFLTKTLFCNPNFIKLCQKLLVYYRKLPAAI
ncbi:MAG: DUF362 domain-containing protein [Candidatus Bathyarchaeia archaeon]